jgi:hypothetical protein
VTATTNTVTIAGASAQTPGIDAAMVAACTGGTLDRFSDDAPKFPGSNYSGWSCTLANANLGFAAGTSLKVIKRDAGGSLVGLQQPINSANPGLMIVDVTCTASTRSRLTERPRRRGNVLASMLRVSRRTE